MGTSTAGIGFDSGTGEVFVANSNDPGTVTVVPVSSGTASNASPTASTPSSATSTPNVPEFSGMAVVLVFGSNGGSYPVCSCIISEETEANLLTSG